VLQLVRADKVVLLAAEQLEEEALVGAREAEVLFGKGNIFLKYFFALKFKILNLNIFFFQKNS
jgi:hypothetical protein